MTPNHFLFVMLEGGGTVPPQLGLARQLIQRGHTIQVLGDPSIAEDAQAAGCTFTPYVRATSNRSNTSNRARPGLGDSQSARALCPSTGVSSRPGPRVRGGCAGNVGSPASRCAGDRCGTGRPDRGRREGARSNRVAHAQYLHLSSTWAPGLRNGVAPRSWSWALARRFRTRAPSSRR